MLHCCARAAFAVPPALRWVRWLSPALVREPCFTRAQQRHVMLKEAIERPRTCVVASWERAGRRVAVSYYDTFAVEGTRFCRKCRGSCVWGGGFLRGFGGTWSPFEG